MTTLHLNRGSWLARKLGLPDSWDAGDTTREMRADRIRQVILERGLADSIVANTPQRGPITYRQAFVECTGEPLILEVAA